MQVRNRGAGYHARIQLDVLLKVQLMPIYVHR